MEDQNLPWFTGSISEAVLKARNEKLLFLSYIHDDTEKSEAMSKLLLDNEVSSIIKEKSVAIEMKKDSDTHKLFIQIFPLFFSPCLIFIQKGKIAFFLNGDATKEKIIESIKKYAIIEDQQENTSTSSSGQQSAENLQSRSTTSTNPTSPLQNSNSFNKQKFEKSKKEYEEKENKYNEYRKLRQQNDERRKQILEQINHDRLEKKEDSELMSKTSSSDSLKQKLSEPEKPKIKNNSEFSVISVRYLDGTLLRNSFKKTDKLGDVRDYINKNIKSEFHPYTLEKQYPNHQFTAGEERKTLLELDLVYNDLLICKPATKVFTANPKLSFEVGKYYSTSFLKEILLFLYAFIMSFNIFSSPEKMKEEAEKKSEGQSLSGKNFSYKKGKIRINQEKKIGTLNDIKNDNKNDHKDKETYNGNSTNQK